MTARSEALFALDAAETARHPEHGMKLALAGIGYAVLDLASAVREAAESRGAQDG